MKKTLLAILVFFILFVVLIVWRYIPITSAEHVQFCVDQHIGSVSYSENDKSTVKKAIAEILENQCSDEFEVYKADFSEKKAKEEADEEIVSEALEDFNSEQAARALINRYWNFEKE